MKKISINPLALDIETIAKLDEQQLQDIVGGAVTDLEAASTGCGSGGSTCGANSTGCGSGGSTCAIEEAL